MTDLLGDTEAWVPTLTDFGVRLAIIRWRMRWNMKEAALACGIPAQNWRIWELDGSLPRDIVGVSERIAERTGVDFDWLVRGPRRPASPNVLQYRRGSQRSEKATGAYARPADGRSPAAPRPGPRRTARMIQSAA